jgi:hypothetical protein
MAGIKIVDLPAVGRDLAATDLFEMSLVGGTGSRKITGQEIMNASKLSVNNTPVINGTAGRIFFQDAANVLQQSANLFWDNTNGRLGIGTSTPTSAMQIVGSTNVEGLLNITNNTTLNFANAVNILFPNTVNGNQVAGFYIGKALSSKNGWGVSYTHSSDGSNSNRGSIDFFGVNSILNWFASGNVAINTTTDAGFLLDVNGTARFSGAVRIAATGLANTLATFSSASGSANIISFTNTDTTGQGAILSTGSTYNYATYQPNQINVIGSGSGGVALKTGNGANAHIRFYSGNSDIDNSPEKMRLVASTGNLLINTTTDDGFKLDVNGTARTSTLTVNNGFTLNSGGTSPNSHYLTMTSSSANASTLQFRGVSTNSTLTFALWNAGIIDNNATGEIRYFVGTGGYFPTFYSNNAERMRIPTTGNVLINTTTDAGFRLDVNGTARVSSGLTTSGIGISTNGGGLSASGPTIGIVSYGGNGASTGYNFTLANTYGGGNVNRNFFSIGENSFLISSFASGTNNVNWFGVYPVINNTGGTTISRGIYYNPTLTSLTGTTHYAFHSTSGRIRFEGLPTSPTGLSAGDLYNDGGTIKIV